MAELNLVQLIINSVITGSIYALIATGLTMICGRDTGSGDAEEGFELNFRSFLKPNLFK